MVTVRCPQCRRDAQFAYYPGDGETVKIGHDCEEATVKGLRMAVRPHRFTFTFDPPRRAY